MAIWNYRLKQAGPDTDGEYWLELVECIYDAGGLQGWHKAFLEFDEVDGFRQAVAWMAEAADRPVLTVDGKEPQSSQ
jgi:hypothetical protein